MPDPQPPALQGTLSVVSLPALVQLAEGELLTGRLELAPAGHLDFAGGQLVGARCGPHAGFEAALELFVAGPERFTLLAVPVPEGPALGEVLTLVMEGCRLADEWARLGDRALVARGPGGLPEALRPLGVAQPLTAAAAAAGIPRARLLDALLHAAESGEVALGDPPPPPAAAPDFYTALDAGRAALRARDFTAAAEAFSAALRARPEDATARQNLARTRALAADAGVALPSPAAATSRLGAA